MGSTRIGIAFPLRGDQFQVSRFSLDGARVTITRMRSIAEAMSNRPARTNTRDQRL